MKIIINEPFNRQVTLISKNLVRIATFLAEHKVRQWIFDRTIELFKEGNSRITIRHTYKERGSHISYPTK